MRESILTIPVNEVFEVTGGCPFCRMRDTVEKHICEYIMGAAVMEPDVRAETNALGFCHRHFCGLLKEGNRLSLGLLLNSRLESVREELFSEKGILAALKLKGDKRVQKAEKIGQTCFVCSKADFAVNHTVKTFFTLFRDEPEFKAAFKAQEFICMPHYSWVRGIAPAHLDKNTLKVFNDSLDGLVADYAKKLNADVSEFCDSFDYRNAGKLHSPDKEYVRTSVNRAIAFLTGRSPD